MGFPRRALDVDESHDTIANMSTGVGFPEPLARAVPRIGKTLRRVADLWPLSALGCAVLVVAFIALFRFGYQRLDLVLLVLGYGGVGLVALSAISVLLTVLRLKVWLRHKPQRWGASRFETGRRSPTGFSLPALRWWPLVRVRWEWLSPPRAEVGSLRDGGRLREQVVFRERGIFERVTRRLVVEDAFGLARIAFRTTQEGAIEILPHLGGIRRLPVLTSMTGGEDYPHPMGLEDGDRVEIRRYIPGDPARFIHWKAFGRTRKLMVRVPERSLSRAKRTVAYLVAGTNDEAAAAAARGAIEEEALGSDWQFAADGSPEATSDRAEALHKVLGSARFAGDGASGLRRFLGEADRRGPAALVVFAPPSPGGWVGEVGAIARRRAGSVRVVVALDALHDSRPRPRWQRWLFSASVVSGVTRAELEYLGRALGQSQCEVIMIDRVSGRILGDASRLSGWVRRAA